MIYLILFIEFFKMGLFTFGGGYAMIPLITETVKAHEWMDINTLYSFIGICESTPGPVAINIATYIGYTQAGVLGSICATIGVVLPSFIIILLVAAIFTKLLKYPATQSILSAVRPVTVGLILSAGLILFYNVIGLDSFTNFNFEYIPLIIFGIILIIYFFIKFVFKKKLNTIAIILISICLGIIVCSIFEYI